MNGEIFVDINNLGQLFIYSENMLQKRVNDKIIKIKEEFLRTSKL